MRRLLILVMALLLIPGGQGAAEQGGGVASPTPSVRSGQGGIDERLVGLLPPADLVGVLDLPTLLNDLLPRLDKTGVKGAAQLSVELNKITTLLGIETKQIRGAAVALTLRSFEAAGLVVIQGAEPDLRKIESLLKSYKLEVRTLEHEGVTIITLTNPPVAPSLGPLTLNATDLAYATLGEGRVAIGELSLVRQAIERRQRPTPVATSQIVALRETDPASLLRFAFTLAPELREAALTQGDLFKSIAAVSVLVGDLQVAPDLAVNLNTIMRTPSAKEAVELEQGLKGLINLGRALLSNGDPTVTAIINQVRVSIRERDVLLRIALPASFIEQMTKKS